MKLTHFLAALWLSLFAFTHPLAAAPVREAFFNENGVDHIAGFFGASVAVSGDTAVIGAPSIISSGGPAGRAFVYVRSGGTWTQRAILTDSMGGSRFGAAVGISGDLIVVGAPGVSKAYVFARTGATWMQQATFKPGNAATTGFGASVAISGNAVAVSAASTLADEYWWLLYGQFGDNSNATGVDGDESNTSAANSGAVYVYNQRAPGRWRQEAYLKASNTGALDNFGFALALQGDTLVVGAPAEQSNATGVNGNQADNSLYAAGAAYVFTRADSSIWSQQAYLKSEVAEQGQGFGMSVALSGDTIVVGSYGETFQDPISTRGAFIYTRNPSGAWSQQATLNAPTPGVGFGQSVALWGDTLVVGASAEGPTVLVGGAVHVFLRNQAGLWTLQNSLYSDVSYSGFGLVAAIDGETIIVGSFTDGNYQSGFNLAAIYAGVGQTDIAVEQPAGMALASGGTRTLGVLPGTATDMVFTLKNAGAFPLTLTGTPALVAVSGSSDFIISAQPAATVNGSSSTTFTVHFAPITAGLKTATLTIPSNDPDESTFIINLTGRGLSFTTDTDGDGMSDAAEFQLGALGFDWQAAQPVLVNSYFANANNNGLYTTAQVQALNVGTPLLQRNPTTGKFTLTIGVKKTNVLGQPFADFPMNGTGTNTSINGAGKFEFEFPSSDNAAFFRLETQ